MKEVIHEKIFFLKTGRLSKVIIKGIKLESFGYHREIEIKIKDPKEEYFHNPIEQNHPRYWKLKNASEEYSRRMTIFYSGLTEKHIKQAIKEFDQMLQNSAM
jgi:hypothetical protein